MARDVPSDSGSMDVIASLRLDPFPTSAAAARRFVTRFCAAADMPEEVCQTAALLVSELVTNAVLHGGTTAKVELHRPAETFRVSVSDNNPDLPAVGQHTDASAEGGRGLQIVSVLAERWGVELDAGGGKAVWFELRVQRG